MSVVGGGTRFIVIGENIHASRVLLAKGAQVGANADGRPAVRFADPTGAERFLGLPDAVIESDAFRNGKVKHVRAALTMTIDGEAGSDDAIAYLEHLARRQVEAGADFLDLNVDEVSPDPGRQAAAVRVAVRAVERVAPTTPVSLDSSSVDVIRAGLEASERPAGPPLLNSASVERLDVLDLAAANGSPVVVTAAGLGAMPSTAAERVANATAVIEAAFERGLSGDRLFVDPLVLPVAVDPGHAVAYLDAVRELRARFGPGIHVTGGLSNVSFGLPERRLLNDVFIALAIDAGADSGIVDPVASDPARIAAMDRDSTRYRLAEALLLGRDLYGADYLAAYRRGELA